MFNIEEIILYVILILGTLNLLKFLILFISTDLYHFYHMFFIKRTEYSEKNKSIAILIPAHNEELVIYKTLESVFENKYNKFKVYIADDGSTDGTKQEIKKFTTAHPNFIVNYIYRPNAGKAAALNNVIKNYVKEDLVMCLDADCILTPNSIERAVKYFNNPNVVSMISNVKIVPSNTIVNLVQRIEYMFSFYLKKGQSVANIEYIIGGAGSTFTRDILQKVNYYDSDTITEDIDLSMKILQTGKDNKIVFGNDVIVWTQGPQNAKDLLKQRFRWKLGWTQTILKHKSIIFNTDKKYNWFFTLYYLPYAILSQIAFLFEPFFLFIIVTLAIMSNSWYIIAYLILYYSILNVISIIGDDSIPYRLKFFYLMLSPFAYFTMAYVTAIEYAASIKCIINYKKIINYKNNKHNAWSHVQRIKH